MAVTTADETTPVAPVAPVAEVDARRQRNVTPDDIGRAKEIRDRQKQKPKAGTALQHDPEIAREILETRRHIRAEEVGLPEELLNKKTLADYLRRNEHHLGIPRRKINTAKPIIAKNYENFAMAMKQRGQIPVPPHVYGAALILWNKGIPLEAPTIEDGNDLLDEIKMPGDDE